MKKSIILITFWLFSIVLIFDKASGNFSGPITNWGTGVSGGSIVFGDIDNDGDLDLIVSGSGRLDKYTNNGSGNFSGTSFGTVVYDSSIALGDIDNDGDLDLIVTGNDGSSRRLDKYTNDGKGNFTGPITNWGIGVSGGSIALGDIDNDGDLDLIVTGYVEVDNYRLDKYINDGKGNFTGPITNWGIGAYDGSIAFGDIDCDGDLDLIVSGNSSGSFRLDKYENDGTGDFINRTTFGTAVSESSIALGDIDADGDLDLIVTGYDIGFPTRRLDKYTNDGKGNFTGPITNWGTGVGPSSVALGDIDNDGDLDLIVSGWDGSGYRLDKYINNGSGNFSGTSFGTGVNWCSIALGDIDNDGDLDLIVTGWDGNNPRLDKYTNTCATQNNLPDAPTSLNAIDSGGYWQFSWSPASDDHTQPSLMRYKIAIGTNSSGVYDYISTNIDYPRGQANIGNIPQRWINNTPCLYKSKIPVTKTVYWKVAAIDTSFKFNWSSEQEQKGIPPADSNNNVNGEGLSIDDIVLAPNLFNPYKCEKDYITFFNCPNDTKIRIYNIVGKKEKELKNPDREHKIIWNTTDSSGKPLPSGVYIAVAEDSKGNVKYIKFVIQR